MKIIVVVNFFQHRGKMKNMTPMALKCVYRFDKNRCMF